MIQLYRKLRAQALLPWATVASSVKGLKLRVLARVCRGCSEFLEVSKLMKGSS